MTSILGIGYASNHRNIVQIPLDKRSQVVLSKKPATVAVVFVHGFNGDALDTWSGFEKHAVGRAEFKNADLYFFGYDGLKSNTLAAASFLFRFLDDVATDPKLRLGSLVDAPGEQRQPGGYAKIVVVAHSLGAVVGRWALLRAADQQAVWRTKISFVLFAPAHCGSELSNLTSEALSGWSWLRAFTEFSKIAVPLLRELSPGSPLLSDLEARIRHWSGREAFLVPQRVLIAEREIVVNNLIFAGDPFPDAIPGSDHVSICKVDDVNMEALDTLARLIK